MTRGEFYPKEFSKIFTSGVKIYSKLAWRFIYKILYLSSINRTILRWCFSLILIQCRYYEISLPKCFTRLLEYFLIQHLIDSLYICMEILEKKEILSEIMTF